MKKVLLPGDQEIGFQVLYLCVTVYSFIQKIRSAHLSYQNSPWFIDKATSLETLSPVA